QISHDQLLVSAHAWFTRYFRSKTYRISSRARSRFLRSGDFASVRARNFASSLTSFPMPASSTRTMRSYRFMRSGSTDAGMMTFAMSEPLREDVRGRLGDVPEGEAHRDRHRDQRIDAAAAFFLHEHHVVFAIALVDGVRDRPRGDRAAARVDVAS